MHESRQPSRRIALKVGAATVGLAVVVVAGTATAQTTTTPEAPPAVSNTGDAQVKQAYVFTTVLWGTYKLRRSAEFEVRSVAIRRYVELTLHGVLANVWTEWDNIREVWKVFYKYRTGEDSDDEL